MIDIFVILYLVLILVVQYSFYCRNYKVFCFTLGAAESPKIPYYRPLGKDVFTRLHVERERFCTDYVSRTTEQNYEFNLIKYNVKFYTKPILSFLCFSVVS